ncbi:MAG: uroporphyrinogen decarboxylase family protein [Acidobacteriota bacterium]|nr:MAG: uroporphyrinogen decarboxylase family protein [Acidobacteriota bacterium]
MNDQQWSDLQAVIKGEMLPSVPVGFIIDCPWLPNWHGVTISEYLASETLWLEANLRALETFPDCWFFPGFWSEFGMCTEPSAFGSRCTFPPDEFPFAEKVIRSVEGISSLVEPNPETDGLLPFMLSRLKWAQPRIEAAGHRIRFSVSRGPLNIASFLMGTTEFLMALRTDPEPVHQLLRIVTDFLRKWHELQQQTFPSIDGIMMLDDIVGFISEDDFLEFGFPYLQEIYALPASVKFFHNDAPCAASIPHYSGLGINLFNPGIQNSLTELRQLGGEDLTILGNIPPRDVLAAGSPQEVREAVGRLLEEAGADRSRLILSCGGGMPPGVSARNIAAFLEAAGYRFQGQEEQPK